MPANPNSIATATTGLDTTVLDRLIEGQLRSEAEDLVRYVAVLILDLAHGFAPHDKGLLQDSLEPGHEYNVLEFEVTDTQIMAIIGTKVVYAVFVEFGTRNAAAQPFLTPAVEAVRDYWAEQISTLFGEGVTAL